jgi:hypothetical protein
LLVCWRLLHRTTGMHSLVCSGPHYWSRSNPFIGRNRFGCREHSRLALVDGSKLRSIARSRLFKLHLCPHGWSMRRTECRHFRRGWAHLDALRSAVIAHLVDRRGVVNHRSIVDIRNVGVANVICSAVVTEVATMPVAALVAPSGIAVSIVDAAVKSNISAPVATIESVPPAAVAPIPRGPKSSLVRGCCPSSRNPVIAGPGIAPVSRSPKIARRGNRRLFIFR